MAIIPFPNRSEFMLLEMKSWKRDSVDLLLCHGISWNEDLGRSCCDCGDLTCTSPGKHPIGSLFPHGEHDATKDMKFLTKALSEFPNANLAVIIKGFFVLDVDGPKGLQFVKSMNLPRTLTFKTGRGFHFYFRGKLPDNLQKIPELDIRQKGYSMVAPSRHKTGVQYRRVR